MPRIRVPGAVGRGQAPAGVGCWPPPGGRPATAFPPVREMAECACSATMSVDVCLRAPRQELHGVGNAPCQRIGMRPGPQRSMVTSPGCRCPTEARPVRAGGGPAAGRLGGGPADRGPRRPT